MTKVKEKKPKTEEEIQEVERRRRFSGYKRRILNNCREGRMREMELQLEYFERNPLARTPIEVNLPRADAIQAFKESINRYKEELTIARTTRQLAK